MMKKRKYTPTELGMIYGMLVGAVVFLVMFALTSEILWILAIGPGVAMGLGIGATMEKRGG